MESSYLLEKMNGEKVFFTRSQVIENARFQASQGWPPKYCYNFGHGEYSKPGYLIFSGKNGCCVCRLDEKARDGAVVLQGWQGEFIYRLGDD